jgi:hypothetical protein
MVVLNWSFDRSVINVMAFPLSGAPGALSTFGVMNNARPAGVCHWRNRAGLLR